MTLSGYFEFLLTTFYQTGLACMGHKKNLTFSWHWEHAPYKSLQGIKVVNEIGNTNWHSAFAHPSITMQNIFNALFPNCIITQT